MTKRGRPPMYSDPDVMQKKIDEYFESLGDGKPTVAGLCWHLGFEDRDALADYGKKEEFSRTVKKARLRIEGFLEEHLYGGQVGGVIFNLKNNFGWRDKHEQEVSGPDGGAIPHRIELVAVDANPTD